MEERKFTTLQRAAVSGPTTERLDCVRLTTDQVQEYMGWGLEASFDFTGHPENQSLDC